MTKNRLFFFSSPLVILFCLFMVSCEASYKIEKKLEKMPGYSCSLEFPSYKKYPALNKLIEDELSKSERSFRDWVCPEQYSDKTDIDSKYSYSTSFIQSSKGRYICVIIKSFLNVGSSIQKESFSFSWDKKTGSVVSLSDVTGLSVQELSEKCNSYLKIKFSSYPENERNFVNDYIDYATKPLEQNFRLFTLKGDKAYVYFLAGKAAPEIYGDQIVEISF